MNIHDAVTTAFDTLLLAAGEPVRYERGNDWVAINAVAGQSTFDVVDSNNVIVQQQSSDWLVRVCDLDLNDVSILPQRGDRIVKEKCNRRLTYEVCRIDDNAQVYRYSDLDRNIIRIHTTLRTTEAL